jgi:hypothetical protein
MKSKMKCCICGAEMEVHQQNNAEPVAHGWCCNECNQLKVLPARIKHLMEMFGGPHYV